MNSHKVDFVICCDMDDSKIVHCCDIGIDLIADSPARVEIKQPSQHETTNPTRNHQPNTQPNRIIL